MTTGNHNHNRFALWIIAGACTLITVVTIASFVIWLVSWIQAKEQFDDLLGGIDSATNSSTRSSEKRGGAGATNNNEAITELEPNGIWEGTWEKSRQHADASPNVRPPLVKLHLNTAVPDDLASTANSSISFTEPASGQIQICVMKAVNGTWKTLSNNRIEIDVQGPSPCASGVSTYEITFEGNTAVGRLVAGTQEQGSNVGITFTAIRHDYKHLSESSVLNLDEFIGTWSGRVVQRYPDGRLTTYDVVLYLHWIGESSIWGVSSYSDLSCSGTLHSARISGTQLIVTETITSGRPRCFDGDLRLERSGGNLGYSFDTEGNTGSAELVKQ
ncbi:hypothetical protein [Gordonia sp. NPDC057248]|uniref:hypothetical protein n=1 Tax=Gordonia sp. NPDC057248 TaxID=3346066 RepID=UPI003626CA1D